MLMMIYQMLLEGVDYRKLGHDCLDKLQSKRLAHYLVKRLDRSGMK